MSVKRVLEELVPDFKTPVDELEQYRTPPEVAVEIASAGLARGCDTGVTVDFGSGTGMITYAAALYGYSYVVGLEVDEQAAATARASQLYAVLANVDFVVADALRPPLRRADCVLENPPFGLRRRGSDFAFVRSALSLRPRVVVSLHSFNERSLQLLGSLCGSYGYRVAEWRRLRFQLRFSRPWHRKRVHYIWAVLVVCVGLGEV